MSYHEHKGMGKGLRVVTHGLTPQEEYKLRQPGVHNPEANQCNPLGKAGSERVEQNPTHPANRKKNRKYSSRSDEKLKQALAEDLATRGIASRANEVSSTKKSTTESND